MMSKRLFTCFIAGLFVMACASLTAYALPNPLVNYKTFEEAKKAAGFNARQPLALPEGYVAESFVVINKELLQVIYGDGKNQLTYRTARGEKDISGDYNRYSSTRVVDITGIKVTMKGTAAKVSLATWNNDKISYSLYFENAVNVDTLGKIINSIGKPGRPGISASVPNPIETHMTVREARNTVGFEAKLPGYLPKGYKMKTISTIDGKIFQLEYSDSSNIINYRTALGEGDISGDYSKYGSVKKYCMYGAEVTVKGSSSKISLATWTYDNAAYSIHFSMPVSKENLNAIVKSLIKDTR